MLASNILIVTHHIQMTVSPQQEFESQKYNVHLIQGLPRGGWTSPTIFKIYCNGTTPPLTGDFPYYHVNFICPLEFL